MLLSERSEMKSIYKTEVKFRQISIKFRTKSIKEMKSPQMKKIRL